jgi:hypothetical protein
MNYLNTSLVPLGLDVNLHGGEHRLFALEEDLATVHTESVIAKGEGKVRRHEI